jgi:hypothetical protein
VLCRKEAYFVVHSISAQRRNQYAPDSRPTESMRLDVAAYIQSRFVI